MGTPQDPGGASPRRATRIVVCLSFVILSFVPLTAPVAAQQSLPAAFVGSWEGPLVQTDPSNEYPVTIDLTGGSVGSVVGAIDYPAGPTRTYPCGGSLSLQSVTGDGSQIALVESYTYGQAYCTLYEATVTLAPRGDGSLAYAWSHPNFAGSLTGTLERTGGAPTSDPTPVPTPTPSPAAGPPSATSVPVPANPEATTEAPSGAFFVTPNSAECVVTPRTAASYPALATELDASMLAFEEAVRSPGLNIPEGVPADPMTTWAVVDTYRQAFACGRANGELGSYALWTDDALRQISAQPSVDASDSADEPGSFRVSDVRVLPDGRVVAVFEGHRQETELTLVQVLVWQGIRFLIDETLDSVYLVDGVDMLVLQPEASAPLPADFVGRWEGTVEWDDATMPVTLDLTGGSVGEVVGTVEYPLYGSAGPTCGGDVSLENIAADGGEIVLVGTITYDATVCLVDATVQISFQDTGAVGYLWNHPALTVSGTGTLVRTPPTN